jgi:hypothetical protein
MAIFVQSSDEGRQSPHPTSELNSSLFVIFGRVTKQLKKQIGFLLQFVVLTITPLISWWQLQFGFKLIWMPGLLLVSAILFWIGTRLRES